MTSRHIPNEEDGNPFRRLPDLLLETPIGIIASAIEQQGIYCWDRFGRFGIACEADKNKALDLLAWVYKVENDPEPRRDEQYSDVHEFLIDNWDHPLWLFGWAAEVCPDFDNLAREQIDVPRPLRLSEQRLKLILTEIAALNHEPQNIPTGGKADIRRACISKHPRHFTKDTFNNAWKEGSREGLFKLKERDKFKPREPSR